MIRLKRKHNLLADRSVRTHTHDHQMTIVGLHALMSAATGILELGLSDSAFLRPDLQAERALGSFEKNSTVGHLDLSRCVGAPSVLTEAILSCRFLQRLVLQAVPAVTDDLIRIVSCSCLHLTHLIVRDCVALSGALAQALQRASFHNHS